MTTIHMETVAIQPVVTAVSTKKAPVGRKTYHRIREVRQQQGISLRTAARHLGTDVRQVRLEEDEANDMKLSDLYRWQSALDVPLADLLVESNEPLSRPVLERARLVRIMKTVQAMSEKAQTNSMKRMAQMLAEQLIELMPELAGVAAWHSVGQRRSLEELGRTAERTVHDFDFSNDG